MRMKIDLYIYTRVSIEIYNLLFNMINLTGLLL